MKTLSSSGVFSSWRGLVPAMLFAVAFSIAPTQEAGAQELKKISFYLDWDGLSAHHMAFWLAKDKGWFAAEGLEVRIVPGRGSGQVAQIVAGGRAEMGVMATAVLVQSVAKQNAPLISVGVVNQKDTLSMSYFESSGIKKPKDIEGRKYGIVGGAVSQLLWPAFAEAAGIDRSKVTVIKTSFQLYMPQFIKKQFDVNGNYIVGSTSQLRLERGGEKVRQFVFSDYLPILGQGVVVRTDTLTKNPKLVGGFLRAAAKAWNYLDASPDKATLEAATIATKAFGKGMPVKTLARFARMTIPHYMKSESTKGKPIGWSRSEDWRAMIDVMARVDKFPRKPTVADVMTNRFFE